MADRSVRGRFVWRDLSTPDTAGAHAFYSKALGWKTQAWDQDSSYQMFVASSGPIGGSVSETEKPPHWLAYISTDDVAATAEQARSLGGRVVQEPTGMPNGGTYAVLADPQGAQFGVYASAGEPGPESAPQPGEFSWHELMTTDYRAAFDFYSALFDWEPMAEHDMGPMGVYFIFGWGGQQKGGMFNKTAEMKAPPMWLGYVRVKDINKTVDRIKAARGSLINGPMQVPGGDWIAQCLDPYGAMFAVHAAAADVKPQASAPARQDEQTAPGAGKPKATAAARKRPAEPSQAPAPAAAAGETGGAQKKKARKRPAAKKAVKAPPAAQAAARPAARKAAKKKAAKKASKKAASKAAKKTAKKTAKKAAKKTVTRAAAKKTARKAGAKAAAKTARKAARKAPAKKKATRKSAARAKAPARKKTAAGKAAGRGRKAARKK